jgi:uncharacterized oligopeptide transporter (OPT) family protein
MDALPYAGAARDILVLVAATAVAHLGAATAVIYMLVDRRVTRIVHLSTLALIAIVYVYLVVLDPGMFIGLLLGWELGHIKVDIPILATSPFVRFSLLVAFLAPLIQRVRRRYRRQP